MNLERFFSFSMCRVLVAICAFAALAACSKAPPPKPEIAEGKQFPPLSLSNSLNALGDPSLRGKMLILNVWATWCPPCRREMPGLERLSKTLDPKRFAVLGMSTDQDERLASEFLLQNGITFVNFHDEGARMAREWNLKVYPETFLIAPDGTLLRRVQGLREWDSPEMMAELEDVYQAYQGSAGKMSPVK